MVAVNPLRYFLRALAFSALRGRPIRARYAWVLAGRAIGGAVVARILGSHR